MNNSRNRSSAIYDRRVPEVRTHPVPDSVRTRHASIVRRVVTNVTPNNQLKIHSTSSDLDPNQSAYRIFNLINKNSRRKFAGRRLERHEIFPYSLKPYRKLKRSSRHQTPYFYRSGRKFEEVIYWENEVAKGMTGDVLNPFDFFTDLFARTTVSGLSHAVSSLAMFYRNVAWHWLVGFALYFQDYVFVQLSLYFPIFDWLADWSPFFMWEVQFELHIWRVFIVVMILFLLVFSLSHFLLGHANKFEQRISLFHFFTIFGSILFYQFTGFAPFIFFIFFSLFTCIYYNFYYYIPNAILRNSAPPHILYLPPPKPSKPYSPSSVDTVKVGLHRYSFFFNSLPDFIKFSALATNKRDFVRRVTPCYPFIRPANLWRGPILVSTPASSLTTELQMAFMGNSPLFTGDWSSSSPNFMGSPLENLKLLSLAVASNPDELYDAEKDKRVLSLDSQPSTAIGVGFLPVTFNEFPSPDGDFFNGLTKEPIGMSNSTLFGITSTRFSRSILRNFFTGEISQDPLIDSANPISWYSRLAKHRNFRLYIWLRNIAPRYHAEPFRSRIFENFLSYEHSNFSNASPLYGFFGSFLRFFYDVLFANFFNFVTLGRYKPFSAPASLTSASALSALATFSKDSTGPFFFPNTMCAHSLATFSRRFSAWACEDLFSDPGSSLLRRNLLFRFELIHFLSIILSNLGPFINSSSYFCFFYPKASRFLYFSFIDFLLIIELLVNLDLPGNADQKNLLVVFSQITF